MSRKSKPVSFICAACSGTGWSRYYEYRHCDQCDGRGTITTYIELSKGQAK